MQNIFSNKKHCFANKFNIITNSSSVNISICFILTAFLFLGIAIYCNTRISGLCLNNESTNTITDNYNISFNNTNSSINLPARLTGKTKSVTLTRFIHADELAGNYISEIMGIVNGTTNFILTKMTKEGMDFDEALKIAQDLGYAEADPTADIEGYDAARKMAIMASIAFNTRVTFDDVATEGITKITSKDIKYAKDMDCTIKLLGVARNDGNGIEVMVHPMLISSNHPLATVNDSFNAVFVHGDAVDDAMFMGRGAGELPTASAIMGDVIDSARNIIHNCTARIGCTCYKSIPIKNIEDTKCKYFLRMQVSDKPGVLASVASVLGNNDVGIDRVIQKTKKNGLAELVVITDLVLEKNFRDAITIFNGMSMINEISSIIRVYKN